MLMTETTLINKVYDIAKCYDPDVDDSTSFEDLVQLLELMKTKALKYEILESAFKKPEPELFPVRQTLAEARARQAEQRQGEL